MDYEYGGLMAQYWDALRGDTSRWPDRAFFRWVIRRSGQPVLDVGCGTGRLLLDYRRRGVDIDGVDLSPEMLAICRRKATQQGLTVSTYEQAMERLNLPRRYRTIIVPSSSFQLVTGFDEAWEALRRLLEHLVTGGTLAMSVMDLDKESHPGTWQLAGEAEPPEGRETVRRWSRTTYDPLTRLEHTEDRYECLRDGHVVYEEHHRRSPATRSYTLREMTAMLHEVGFAEVRSLSGFSMRPATQDDRLLCFLATSRPVRFRPPVLV